MVRRKVKWSVNALNDKFIILDYWYRTNGSIKYSKKLNNEILVITSYLKKHNKLGKSYDNSNTRYLIKNHLIIIYEIHNDFIEILRIKDTRQDLSNLPL